MSRDCRMSRFGCIQVVVLFVALIVGCHAPLTLTSNPSPSTTGSYCADVGRVIFTCTGTAERGINWVINGTIPAAANYVFPNSEVTYPQQMLRPSGSPLDSPDINVTVVTASAVSAGSDIFNVVCTLTVGSSILHLKNANLHCEGDRTDGSRSNSTLINVKDIPKAAAPLPTCSLHPTPESEAEVSLQLQWSPSFTSQYVVEKYRVSVNPDPSSCSSDQVSPSEDYSCSGLELQEDYIFIVSAINCGDQEGDNFMSSTLFNGLQEPSSLMLSIDGQVQWRESVFIISGQCTISGSINYTVEVVDSTGEVVNQTMVTSDSCSNGICSTSVPLEICIVRVQATSLFGNSGKAFINVAGVQLTATNKTLLGTGVAFTIIAFVFAIILFIMFKKGSKISFVLSVVGFVLGLVAGVLWIAVGFQVGLQGNLYICDPSWQSTRDALIIAAHVISDLAFLVEVIAAGFVCVSVCCGDYCISKSASNEKAHKYVFKWLSPTRARTGPTNNQKEIVELAMEEHKKCGFQRGAGGRVAELEAEDIIVDEMGENQHAGASRAREEVFQKYDCKLKEEEEADRKLKEQEADQYDTTSHVKTPASATPTQQSTQPATYSVLDRYKEKVTGGRGVGEYQQLDHKGKGGVEVDNRKHLPPSEEYETLETETPPGPPPGGVRKAGKEVCDNSNGQDKEKSPSAPKKPARSPAAQPNTSSSKGTGSASGPGSKAPAAQPNTSSKKVTGSVAVAASGTNGNRAPDTVDGDGDHKARSRQIKKDYDALAKKFQRGKLNMVLDEEHGGEDTHLVRIAAVFEEDWDTTVAPALGLAADEIKTIKRKYRNKAEQKRQALKTWKDREGKKATYGNLLRHLVTCENKLYASSLPDLWSSSV